MIRKALFVGIILFASTTAIQAQGTRQTVPEYKVPINRQLFHDAIDNEQKNLLASDGRADKQFSIEYHEDIAPIVTDAIINKVDWMQYWLETDTQIEPRVRIGYLIGMADVLRYMRTGWRKKEVYVSHFAQIIALYKKLIEVNNEKGSLMPYLNLFPYDIVYAATLPRVFEENPSYGEVKDLLLIKYSALYPEKTFQYLTQYTDLRHTDSLIKDLGRRYPEQLYTYAQSEGKLGRRIKNIKDDDFIKTVVSLSELKSGQVYFPFIDNLVKGKITTAELDAIKDDRLKYYRLLVQTQLDYSKRAIQGDTAIGFRELTNRLGTKARDEFVTEINSLHEKPDGVRFAVLQSLTAQELFYLAVMSDGLIYTSSYVRGVFPLMMQKANNRGDQLLLSLSFDHYRKFISQAASYNTLKTFFASFPKMEDARNLMTTFVSGLENTRGLEDGVDVADSYASIYETMPDLAKQMLANIKNNYDRNKNNQNTRGMAMYNILYKLFLSADPSNKIDLSKELKIPPVYSVSFNSLTNEKGEIITQMFFYGDDDGKLDFDIFLRMFNSANWTIDQSNKYWVVAKTIKGAPVYIYANRPLPNESDEDYVAQNAMEQYLMDKNLQPTITFHRGHSYHAPTSIGYMSPTSKIVFMGTCGGYILIDSILKKSSDAHIISSKQIGKRDINRPFILLLTEKLRNRQNIDWIPFWKEFRAAANITGLEDYVPPYKNLGALFIKSYKREAGEDIF